MSQSELTTTVFAFSGCFKLVRHRAHNRRRSRFWWRCDARSSNLRRFCFTSQRHARRRRRSWRHASFASLVTQRGRQFSHDSWIWDCQDNQGEGVLPVGQPSEGRDVRVGQAVLCFARFDNAPKIILLWGPERWMPKIWIHAPAWMLIWLRLTRTYHKYNITLHSYYC